jgi:hypothetical protein
LKEQLSGNALVTTEMLKNWKKLFVKSEDGDAASGASSGGFLPGSGPSFPVSPSAPPSSGPIVMPPPANDPVLNEVLSVYENGLDSINMPGYDFYEFYMAITGTGNVGEQAYNMAYSMAKTMDRTISTQKLLTDAEFYISKINEVHSQYSGQGQQKLNELHGKKTDERNKLNTEIDQANAEITQIRERLRVLENEVNQKRTVLGKIDDSYYPQEKTIREKLNANDSARRTSIDRLNMVKDGIQRYIKN